MPIQTRIKAARLLSNGPLRSPMRCAREKLGDFCEFMRNRLAFGEARYGDLHADPCETMDNAGHTGNDLLLRLKQKVALFEMTRNHEMLPDIANYAALLYNFDDHPGCTWRQIDQGVDEDYQELKDLAWKIVLGWRVTEQ